MINFDCVTKENIKDHNPIWSKIPKNPYRMLIICKFCIWKKIIIFAII